MTILGFISILGFVFSLAYFIPLLKNVAVIFTICSIIVLLFLCGSIGILSVGSKIILIGGLLLFLATVSIAPLKMFTTGQLALKVAKTNPFSCISLGTWIFVLSAIIWFILSRHAIVFGWDEYFWAQFTKTLKLTGAFYGPNDAVLSFVVRYPPGSPLFQYFFITLGSYKESALYFANGLFLIAGVTTLIDLTTKKILEISLAGIISSVLIITFYSDPYISLHNDPIIGILFGVGLSIAAFYQGKLNALFIILLPIVSVLPLIKETGLIFALTISGVFMIRVLFEYKENQNQITNSFTKYLLEITIAFVMPFIMRTIWNYHLAFVKVLTPYKFFNLHNAMTLFFNPRGVEQIIAEKFYAAFFTQNICTYTALFLLIFLFISYLERRSYSKELIQRIGIFGVISSGLLLYLGVILISYVFVFPTPSALILSSYSRYMNSYLLGIGFLALVSLVRHQKSQKTKFTCYIITTCILVAYIYYVNNNASSKYYFKNFVASVENPKSYALNIFEPTIQPAKRNEIVDDKKLISKYVPLTDNVWFIYQNTIGYEQMIFRYEITPRKTNPWYWSLGTPYTSSDIWTGELSPEIFARLLDGRFYSQFFLNAHYRYQYLFLGFVDNNFWQHYGTMFTGNLNKDKHYKLFTIIRDKSGMVYFKPIIATDLYHS